MLKVTADTNIYISALNFGGLPDKLLDLARSGEIQLSISDDILDETARVLHEKFRWTEEAVALARERIGDFTDRAEPSQRVEIVTADPTDNRILECAQAAGSQYIVSGDKHLLHLDRFEDIRIVTPAKFLQMFSQPSKGRE